MNPSPAPDEAEAIARRRYMGLNLARVGAIALAIAGMAGTRELLPLPYIASVVITVVGVLAFFFAPPLLVKRWKAQDRANGSGE